MDPCSARSRCSPPGPGSWRDPRARYGASCSEVELEHADGVAADELAYDVVGKPGHQLLRHLLRVRPRGVGVRVIGLERRVVDTDRLERFDAVPVPEEAPEHLAVVVGGRRLRHDVAHAAPGAMLEPHVVGTLEDVRDPTDLTLAVRELELGEPNE